MDLTALAMCSAGVALFLIGAIAARHHIVEARGLDKIVALGNLGFALPLAVFGALHLFGPQLIFNLVPEYMPWRLFWVYAVGAALLVVGGSVLLSKKTREVASCVGGWIVLIVLAIYGPLMIQALAGTDPGVKVEGINYFADTLLFAGAILSLAKTAPRIEPADQPQ